MKLSLRLATGWKLILALLVLLGILLAYNMAHAAPATPTAPTSELFPDNIQEAAQMYGVEGERSADSVQWQAIDGGFNLIFGDTTKINVNQCAYGRYYNGENVDYHGPVEFSAETASFYRDWDTCPDPVTPTPTETPQPPPTATPYPDVPVGPALSSWPATAADAAWAFSAPGMQTIVESEVGNCGSGNDCWKIIFSSIRPVSIPVGAIGQTDQGMVTNKGVWVTEITLWRDWDVLPEVPVTPTPTPEPGHPDLITDKWLGQWPATQQEAAAAFSSESGTALDPQKLTNCDGGIGECWVIKLDQPQYILIPHGAIGQVSETEFKAGVSTWVSQVTLRHDWEAYKNLPPQLYVPLLFK